MKRLLLLGALLVVGVAPAGAVSDTYSTGNINAAIGSSLDFGITVPKSGPLSYLNVSFRISTPDTSQLAVSIVSPKGTEVPLVTNRGAGANFGDGKGCTGILTVLDSDMDTNPVSAGKAPFTDNPYRPEGDLSKLYGESAKGKWILRVKNAGPAAHLECLTLYMSRAVPEVYTGTKAGITAKVSFVERNYQFDKLRVQVTRKGRKAVDAPLVGLAGCRGCTGNRVTGVAVRDLDGGEPEVIVDMFTGGAHCCQVNLILRWDAAAKRYRSQLADFGNYGRRVVDLDKDGLPEFSAYDERFIYEYTAYVFSSAPPQVTQYRQGKWVDVTRDFPVLIKANAAYALKQFAKLKKAPTEFDARAFVATYVADQYLLGQGEVGERALQAALAKGILYKGKMYLGTPAGAAFVAFLHKDLRKWGYIR